MSDPTERERRAEAIVDAALDESRDESGSIYVDACDWVPLRTAERAEARTKWKEAGASASFLKALEMPERFHVAFSSNLPGCYSAGECRLHHVHRAAESNRLGYQPDNSLAAWAELRFIDDQPHTGAGMAACIDLSSNSLGDEVVYLGPNYEPHRMQLNVADYLTIAMEVRGWHLWQYMFIDDDEHPLANTPYVEDWRSMLDWLPKHFPDADLRLLRARAKEIGV